MSIYTVLPTVPIVYSVYFDLTKLISVMDNPPHPTPPYMRLWRQLYQLLEACTTNKSNVAFSCWLFPFPYSYSYLLNCLSCSYCLHQHVHFPDLEPTKVHLLFFFSIVRCFKSFNFESTQTAFYCVYSMFCACWYNLLIQYNFLMWDWHSFSNLKYLLTAIRGFCVFLMFTVKFSMHRLHSALNITISSPTQTECVKLGQA